MKKFYSILILTLMSNIIIGQNNLNFSQEPSKKNKVKNILLRNELYISIKNKNFIDIEFAQNLRNTINITNHKIIEIDYCPIKLRNFGLNLCVQYDYSNYRVPVLYDYLNQIYLLYDVKVRNLPIGTSISYDFYHSFKNKKKTETSKLYRLHIQFCLSFMAFLTYNTNYYYQDQMKMNYKKGVLNSDPKYVIRDEIKLFFLEKKSYSLGAGVGNFLYGQFDETLDGPVDYIIGFRTFGLNLNFHLK